MGNYLMSRQIVWGNKMEIYKTSRKTVKTILCRFIFLTLGIRCKI